MTQASIRILISAATAAAFLSGCVEQGTGSGEKPAGASAADAGAAPDRRARRGSNNDVESPEVFSSTDEALWDGRPSLGGIWVASPDATNPERVLMKNPENGKTVTGALFRRERENPGPKLQISSDAAAALGLLAGQPATISVIALRREELPAEEPEPEAVPEDEAAPEGEAVAEAATVEDAAAPAESEAPADGSEIGAAAVAAIGKEGAAESADTAAGATEAAGEAAASVPAEAKRPGLFGRLFGKRTPKAEDAGAPLSAIDEEAAAANPPAPVETTPIEATGAVQNITIGAFGVEDNAKGAAEKLGQAGFTVEIQPGKIGEKPIWTVIASAPGNQADLLAKVKALGYADAYVSG